MYLPKLQDHQFHDGIQQAKQSARQTVDKLHQFDHQQTQSFTALVEDLSLINSYIEEMSKQFTSGKIKLSTFSPLMLQDLEAYGNLQTRLYNQTVMQRWNSEHYPELGVFYPVGHAASFDQWVNPSCARPKPKKKTAGEAFWDFTTGFGAGIVDAASDTWDGLKRLVTEPDQVVKETIEFVDAVASDPAILLEIGHELYNSFNESVIHGDASSRGEWLGYATTVVGTAVVGDKGISRVGSTVGRLGTRVEADLNIKLKDQQAKAVSSAKSSSAVGLERVRELMGRLMPNHHLQPGFAGVPHNVMDGSNLRQTVEKKNHYILTKVLSTNHGSDISKPSMRKKEGYSTRIDNQVKEIDKAPLPSNISSTFKDSKYRTVVTEQKILVYRAFGGHADAGGTFVTTTPSVNKINAKLDLALLPEWKNTRNYEAVIEVPQGTVLNIGRAEKQYTKSGTVLQGNEDQILLPLNYPLSWIKEINQISSK